MREGKSKIWYNTTCIIFIYDFNTKNVKYCIFKYKLKYIQEYNYYYN